MFKEGALLTQDTGRLSEEGWVYIDGRVDEVILSGGVNLHPQEIESCLAAHPAIQDVGVIGVTDPQWGARPVAYLTLTPHMNRPTDHELISWCKTNLSTYKCPDQFHWRAELPRDSLGKLIRRHLLMDFQAHSPTDLKTRDHKTRDHKTRSEEEI